MSKLFLTKDYADLDADLERVIAIEAPSLADRRDEVALFVDPQHSDNKNVSAIMCVYRGDLYGTYEMPADPIFVTDRFDVDSVGAYLLLSGQVPANKVLMARVLEINKADCGLYGPYVDRKNTMFKPVVSSVGSDPTLNPLNVACMRGDFQPLKDYLVGPQMGVPEAPRLDGFSIWTPWGLRPHDDTSAGHFQASVGYSTIVGSGPGASSVGYFYSPLVLAFDPDYRGSGVPKTTIMSWAGHVDLSGLAKFLNERGAPAPNDMWGGQKYIIGSPFKAGSPDLTRVRQALNAWLSK